MKKFTILPLPLAKKVWGEAQFKTVHERAESGVSREGTEA